MIGVVKRYICDACQKEQCVGENEQLTNWVKTEYLGFVSILCKSVG